MKVDKSQEPFHIVGNCGDSCHFFEYIFFHDYFFLKQGIFHRVLRAISLGQIWESIIQVGKKTFLFSQ
jgi:hypothetical protein